MKTVNINNAYYNKGIKGNILLKNEIIFQPSDYANCVLWLDAADSSTITLNNSTVSQWDDKSGNNKHAVQSTEVDQPVYTYNALNNRNVLTFADSQYLQGSSLGILGTNAATVFIVCTPSTNPQASIAYYQGKSSLVALTSRNIDMQTEDNKSGFRFVGGGCYNEFNEDIVNGTSYVVTMRNADNATAAEYERYLNGVLSTTAASAGTPNTTDNIYIIGDSVYHTGDIYAYIGDISEVIVYNRAVTDSEREHIEQYLANKWGITLL